MTIDVPGFKPGTYSCSIPLGQMQLRHN